MIRRLYVNNYKCLVNFELRLRELTLLLGPNGSGKTSVLGVMYALRRLLSGGARLTDADVFPAKTITRWQSGLKQAVEVDVELEGDALRYRLELEHEAGTGRARIVMEALMAPGGRPLFVFEKGNVSLFRDDHSAGPTFPADWSESFLARVVPRPDNLRLTRFRDFMQKVIVCGLSPAGFDTESRIEDTALKRDASNFVSWYRHVLQEEQHGKVSNFIRTIQETIDGFRDIRLERVGLDARAMMVMFEESGRRYDLRFDEISDGQRALIVLYALIRLAA
ncbi:MAG: ATP-binding protein, partial [Planctomycetota bacterium]|nr:ATP-binding protein [Planctomycetota bacterium]